MKKLSVIALFMLLGASIQAQEWVMVYQNDAEGNKTSGSKEALLAAVRAGVPIRIGWGSARRPDPNRPGSEMWIEHVADAKFLTIMSGKDVFAQIDPIVGQTPDFKEMFVELKENLSWTSIMSTNGKSDNIMRNLATGEITGHNKRNRGVDWYVLKQ